MKKNVILSLIAYFILQFNVCYAQPINFSGKSFYYCIYTWSGLSYQKICLCSLQGTNGYFINPVNDTIHFLIPPNSCDTFGVLSTYSVDITGSTVKAGNKIVTESPVTTYLYSGLQDSIGFMGRLPLSTLIYPDFISGLTYLFNSYMEGLYYCPFIPLSFYDSTSVFIKPNPSSFYGSLSNPYFVSLNDGYAWADGSAGNVTGSLLTSDSVLFPQPFALFAARDAANGGVPFGWNAQMTILEQQLPIDKWKTLYHAVPHQTRQGDLYRILAAYDSTQVTINGTITLTLNATAHFDTLLTMASTFTANKPININEISQDPPLDSVQKSGAFMYPLMSDSDLFTKALFITDLDFNYYGLISNNYLNMICRTVNASLVKLDGVSVGASFLPYTNDSSWSYAQLSIANGQHLIESDSGVIAYEYGYGSFRGQGNVVAGNTMLYPTGIRNETKNINQLTLYPNPVNNTLSFTTTLKPKQVYIYDMLGKELLKENINSYSETYTVNVSSLKQGMYMLVVETKDKVRGVRKFVKQ